MNSSTIFMESQIPERESKAKFQFKPISGLMSLAGKLGGGILSKSIQVSARKARKEPTDLSELKFDDLWE